MFFLLYIIIDIYWNHLNDENEKKVVVVVVVVSGRNNNNNIKSIIVNISLMYIINYKINSI